MLVSFVRQLNRFAQAVETLRSYSSGSYALIQWFYSLGGCLLLAALLVADRLPIITEYLAPSGADPGNWLTLAWELQQPQVRLAGWAYPPLTFVLLRGLLSFLEPLLALRVLGLAAWLLLGYAMFMMLRVLSTRLPFYLQLGIAWLFMFSGFHGEMFAWGGYPQLLGMALLVVAIPASEQWIRKGISGWGILAVISIVAVVFTHHLLTGLLPPVLICLVFWCLFVDWNNRQVIWKRSLLLGLVSGILSLLALPIYGFMFANLAHNPANPNGFSLATIPLIFDYVFRESLDVWFILLLIVLVIPLINRKHPLSGTVFVLTWIPLAILPFLLELRSLHLVIAGISYGLVIVMESLWGESVADWRYQLQRGAVTLGFSLILLAILPGAHDWFNTATTSTYRIADDKFLVGLDWLRENTDPKDRVAASHSKPDLIGWWVEGYARRSTIYATDLRWLAFRDEQAYAVVANEIFDSATPLEKIRQYLADYNIAWVFVDKTSPYTHLLPLVKSNKLIVNYENERVLILRVGR